MTGPSSRATSRRSSSAVTPVGSRAASPTRVSPPLSSATQQQHNHLQQSQNQLVLLNPTGQPPQRLLSFIKYCLRCAGVLYHCWPESGSSTTANGGHGSSSGAHEPSSANPWAQHGLYSMPGTPTLESIPTTPGGAPTSPTTPLFAPGGEKLADGWGTNFLFECVIELPEEQEEPEEALTLVQTIMAAFGRRPAAAKRSSSTPGGGRSLTPGGAGTPRGAGGGGADTPARAAPGPSGKDGRIRCLRFHMMVRFPRPSGSGSGPSGTGTRERPPYLRSTSAYGKRSRASSATGHANAESGRATPSNVSSTRSSRELSRNETITKASSSSHRGSNASAPSVDSHAGEVQLPPSHSAGPQEHDLQIITSPDGLLNLTSARAARSPTSSRASSRVRVSGSVAPSGGRRSSRKSRVYIQISDERAVETIKKALSVGGTQDASDIEDENLTDGNETDSSRRSVRYHRSSLLRSQSAVNVGRISRPPSRGPSERDEPTQHLEMRGRQPRLRVAEDLEMMAGSPVKEESPSSFDIESMITECGGHIGTITRREQHALDDAGAEALENAIKAARDLLLTMSRRFAALEKNEPVKLVSVLSPWSFNFFSALSPALGLDAEQLLPLRPGASPAEVPALRYLAAEVLQLVARQLSPREVFVAVQERLELLLADDNSPKPEAESDHGSAVTDRSSATRRTRKPTHPWSAALEVAALLGVLKTGELRMSF